MKKIIAAAIVVSMLATPAAAKIHVGDVLLGGVLGAVIVDATRDHPRPYYYNNYQYTQSYTSNYNNDPCYYSPSDRTYRSDPERAEYERGRMARLCQEMQMRKQRAYECGYNGNC